MGVTIIRFSYDGGHVLETSRSSCDRTTDDVDEGLVE